MSGPTNVCRLEIRKIIVELSSKPPLFSGALISNEEMQRNVYIENHGKIFWNYPRTQPYL